MSDSTLWSADLGTQLHIDTDANMNLWGYLYLHIDRKHFKEWLGYHLTYIASFSDIAMTRSLRRYHKYFYQQTIVTLRDKLKADEAFIYHPVPLTYMPLVVHATRIHCEASDASACEGLTAAGTPNPELPEWQHRMESVPFPSPHLGDNGVRVTGSYPADSSIMMSSVTYHWHTPPGRPDVLLRGHHDDPELMAAALNAVDDFARTLRLPETTP